MSTAFARLGWQLVFRSIALLGIGASVTSAVWAQEPVAQAGVDFTTVTVGDRITLTITVRHDSAQVVGWPEAPADLDPFEVLHFGVSPPSHLNDRRVSRAQYVLTTFDLGDLEVPSIELALRGEGAAESRVLLTDPVPISVVSVQPDSADIVDIKAPLAIARNWLLLVPWALGLLIATALGYWAYRRYRSRARPEAPKPATPPRPADVVANEALDRLEAAGLLERGEIKQHYVEVSEIMRVYVEGRYGIDAMELTSHDIEAELRNRHVKRQALERFTVFHERCDLVKFAKLRPGLETTRAIVPLARELVRITRPEVPAPATADTAERPEPAAAVT
jgi:hypothetical protein